MKTWTMAVLGAAAAMGAAGTALAAGPPAELKPAHVAGPGLYVADLEAQRAWYSDKLGLAVRDTIQRGGTAYEYVMGYGDGPNGAILALAKSTTRPAGPNAFSRVILATPNARGLADWLKGQGVETREVIPNVAYFIRDPEGNNVELYTAPPKP
ncbi:MAG TPA: VOC family protein [Phenylobacterium sp.]|jgi:catechol 2,3-dioxygenase-like lactoylglutathione lyase family enzyme|uniref:VOC family protein n=1 Tax=Phenylobacterium sp. TaxID=1871053 RepID=UPI002CA2CFD3|nr:VOC family protein [Phenylobacterium sp.]HXA38787.1 VOC family protein [Phenylobacterium sp.]